jgi:hypothetical protein
MKTLDLRQEEVSVEELLRWANSDSVLIRDREGHEFVLEEADDFDREVASLGANKEFMAFLEERSKEEATLSLDDVKKALGLDDQENE